MQKKSIEKLAKFAVPERSSGRFFKEKRTDIRNDFQRDRDRIIHSTAFRRLKHKTQVFVNTTGDHYRTRITHSLEVAQIARTLAKYFKLNEDLCETLSLAHDLGHTPFGHAGEEALNDCMKGIGGFDHNNQTIRIVTLLENKYYNFNYEMKSLVSRQSTISIGDKMSCIIESVHPYEGKISLIPA